MLSPFGAWVRAFRQEKEITLREMARTLKRSPSFFSALELGRKSTPTSLLDEIADAYQLDDQDRLRLSYAINSSRISSKIRFDDRTKSRDQEVALLFARNFDNLSDEQIEKIKAVLEDNDE
ncbi:MAG: helix-turn-helix domain-containing protein [Devosiaceae bacterium]|nr:helix-turn-helix domain-containing protein [Devosiaceae bacterium MH13]